MIRFSIKTLRPSIQTFRFTQEMSFRIRNAAKACILYTKKVYSMYIVKKFFKKFSNMLLKASFS